MDISGRFSFGTKPSTLDVKLLVADDPNKRQQVAMTEFILHLPQGSRQDGDAFVGGGEGVLLNGEIVYDKDPGHVSLDMELIPRRDFLYYTAMLNLDGQESHHDNRSGDIASHAWKVDLDSIPVRLTPTGTVVKVNVEGTVGSVAEAN